MALFDVLLFATLKFYSRIVLRKLSRSQLTLYRKVERISKIIAKCKADLKFLKFCLDNQLLPKFTNFRLYDVTAAETSDCKNFRIKLLENEIKSKENTIKLET